MATITLTADDWNTLNQLAYKQPASSADISAAWELLGSKGDSYGWVAGQVVSTDTAHMSLPAKFFYKKAGVLQSNISSAMVAADATGDYTMQAIADFFTPAAFPTAR